MYLPLRGVTNMLTPLERCMLFITLFFFTVVSKKSASRTHFKLNSEKCTPLWFFFLSWVGFNQDSKTLVNVWMQICAKFSSKQTIMSLYRQSAGILPFVTHRDDRSRPTNLDSAEPLRHGKISAAKNGLVPCHPLGWRSFQRGILSHRCPYLHSTRTQHPFSTRCRSSIIEDGTNLPIHFYLIFLTASWLQDTWYKLCIET